MRDMIGAVLFSENYNNISLDEFTDKLNKNKPELEILLK